MVSRYLVSRRGLKEVRQTRPKFSPNGTKAHPMYRAGTPAFSNSRPQESMTILVHCTQKLLAEIQDRLIDPSASGESWHANVLRFDRRKCVLFTHDATLYSVFVPGLKKPDFEHLDEVFGQRLFKALLWDEFPQTQIERMLEERIARVSSIPSSARKRLIQAFPRLFPQTCGAAPTSGNTLS